MLLLLAGPVPNMIDDDSSNRLCLLGVDASTDDVDDEDDDDEDDEDEDDDDEEEEAR